MKKYYLLTALLLSIFSFYTSARNFNSDKESNKKVNSCIYQTKYNLLLSTPTKTTTSSIAICEGNTLTLTANPSVGIAPYTFSWTGPNGFVSTEQNPVINSISLSSAGDYNVTITDSAFSTFQNTTTVVVNAKIDPTFDAILPAICKGGIAPLLSTTSTIGITGTWNPPTVSNTTSGTYTFTPDAGQCANSYLFTVFVINNVTPTFSLPSSLCQGDTPPILSNVSNNGIVGSWSPSIVSNTKSGSYTFSPSIGQCATTKTITININPSTAVFLPAIPPICAGDTLANLPTTSSNGITGTWSPPINNTSTTTYIFTPTSGQCATATASMTITVNQKITPTFDAIPAFCYGSTAPVLSSISNNEISGTWNPDTISNTTSGTYIFTPDAGQCATNASVTVTVNPKITPTFDAIPAFCNGSIAPVLASSSNNGFTGTWNPATISNTTSGTYIFTPDAGQCATNASVTVTVNPKITPTFDAIPAFCYGSTAPVLASSSTNGFTGTWNPATISNTNSGTYIFTPDAGQCATNASVTVTVNPKITPTFDAIPAFCNGSIAPILASSSNNGFTGTWNPATISNTTSGTYIFTPDAGQCATNASVTVTVNPKITPTFDTIPAFCNGSIAPVLASSSNNGFTGTWNPATISNTTSGTYIFTPDAGQCSTNASVTVTVNPKITPTFDAIPAFCNGSIAPVLASSSNNGFTGTWNPASISNTNSGTYIFTPDAGQCATNASVTVTVNPKITPTFDAIPAFCNGSIAPVLASSSNNGFTGTWNPASISNTTSGTYIFTPDAGQCATNASVTVTVNPKITPTFDAIPTFCNGSTAPVLSSISNNEISGTWNPATISNTTSGTYIFTPDAGQCATNASVTVTVNPKITPTFDAIPAFCNGSIAPVLASSSNNGFTGTWNPASISNTNSGTYIFTPDAGQCATNASVTVTVNPKITPTFDAIPAFCNGSIAPVLSSISNNEISGTWNPATISNTNSGTYIFTPDAGQCATNASVTVTVNQKITPTFDAIPAFCNGSIAPVLASSSTNGFTGTWNPATISNTTSGTYIFTPDAGQCATNASVTVTVNPKITPTFDAIPAFCYGSIAPVLSSISNNEISGTWNPATISNAISGTYIFTPDAGQCATNASVTVTVNPKITPTFDAIPAFCNGSIAPVLASSSTNGFTGTWNPATISNTISGTYIFTPDAGQCATNASVTVTVNPKITPTFDAIPAFCNGSIAPVLASSSNNGFTGTWNPATISNTISGTYIFTPDAGQCATNASVTVTVNPKITPTFDAIPAFCYGSIAPVLASSSNNGFTGTWNPAIISNTTSGTYIFTPDAGQCATNASVTVTVNPKITPTFDAIPAFCNGSIAPVLSSISNNEISGTWNPATISNTTSGTYIFTPDAGQCATNASVTVTVNPKITPTFDAIPAFCYGTIAPVLASSSNNGFTGTWNPATISNTTSGTYIFTPDAGQCATNASVTVTVNPKITPTFDAIPAFCYGSIAPILASSSNNGFTGTWNPATISNTTSGTYIFTPDAGQCATNTSVTVTVNPKITPTFDAIPAFCYGSIAPILASFSTNEITGTWNPAIVSNTTSGTYIFTPDAGQCATNASVTITVNQKITPTFDAIPAFCYGSTAPVLSSISNNEISGTWNPDTISNTTSGTYIFTPDAGQCATNASVTVTVNPKITPTFDAIPAFCYGSIAPVLASSSNNGFTGTWNPATISNTNSGTYIFTPDAGQCATNASVTVTVNPKITPTFDAIPAFCYGSTAPVLSSISNNEISGTWNPATISNTNSGTYIFTPDAGQCATNASVTVTVNPKITPTFDAIPAFCNGSTAPVLSSISNNEISGTWNPATISNTTSGTYIFTPDAGQCATNASVTVTVNPKITPTFDAIPAFCNGSIAPVLSSISNNEISGTWNPATISNTISGTYIFTPDAGQCATNASVTVTVNPKITPTFDAIPAFCNGSIAPVLASSSNNGFTGTWNPASISNTTSGTYIFTPDAGQCATNASVTVTVNPKITPTFDAIPAFCNGSIAPVLASSSNNGFTGTWNPASISNTTSGTYIFTPDAGQCATNASVTVTVNLKITPTFDAIPAFCYGSTVPVLSSISNNEISGTWNPASISNTTSGTYIFTPDAGQCATNASVTVTVNPKITPTFDAIPAFCYGSIAPVLSSISNNEISGTWNPATISNTNSGTYIFTPDAGQCATNASVTVTVNPKITPTFDAIPAFCYGSTAPVLSSISNNEISGTWNPATISNTTSGTYIFTPDAGQCATNASVTVTVNPKITPTFDAIPAFCNGSIAPVLASSSNNGFTGTWNPATISNTTSGTYIFTPDAGQCATNASVTVTVNPKITPTFDAIPAFCYGSTAPVLASSSNNGFTGTWNPATISNTTSGTYIFTPDAGQCATNASVTVTVNPKITPTFDAIPAFCYGSIAPILASSSNNGFTGTWNPASISNTNSGTYIFTPDAGQCATNASVTVTVNPKITPTFDAIPAFCYGSIAPVLASSSNNGFTGTWNPATISNTTSGTYIFTPDSGTCVTTAALTINVNAIIPSFNTVAPICTNSAAPILTSTSTNGITGTWNPAIVSNTTSGTYIFTPDAGQCAPNTSLTITVNPIITPIFTAIPQLCSGGISPILPLISNNSITGTWNPATINNTTSGTYTFTPNTGQCAIATTLNVTVTPNTTPTFADVAPICSGSATPVLPTISNNLISGTWNPAIVSNTASGIYTFTPSINQCGLSTTLSVTVYQSPTDINLKTTDVVNDGLDGIIEIMNITSGVAPYQYSLNNGPFTANTTYPNLISGNYTLTVKDSNGCEFNKAATISSICMFPNVITPNNDSSNDSFNLKGCDVVTLELFNRYGRKVNSYTNYTNQWDGTNSQGESLPDGTYFYVAEMKGGATKSGWVYLTR